MAMRKAMMGGACAPGGEGQTMGNNPLTNMLDHMISGGASAAQRAEGYGPMMNQENLAEMNEQFDKININEPQAMQPAPMAAPQQEYVTPDMSQMNDLWDSPIEKIEDNNIDSFQKDFTAPPMAMGPQMFGVPGMMNPMMHRPPMANYQRAAPKVEEVKEEIKEEVKITEDPEKEEMTNDQKDEEIKRLAGDFATDLLMSGNEKVQNSDFMQFLRKLNTGALEVGDNEIIENAEKTKEFESKEAEHKRLLDQAYNEASAADYMEESKEPKNFVKIEDAIKEKEMGEDFDMTNIFRDVWDQGEMDEHEVQNLISNWKSQAERAMQDRQEIMKEQPTEIVMKVPKEDLFKFDENNPYLEHDNCYDLAKEFNEELKVNEAIKALEANLMKNEDHSPSWRLLGQLYQENDQDDKAIAYFQKAYDLDPYDLDSLL